MNSSCLAGAVFACCETGCRESCRQGIVRKSRKSVESGRRIMVYFSKIERKKEEKNMLFTEYPKCTTCQKAKKWLDAHGIAYTDRHIKEENPTAEELKRWHEMSGLPLKRFFNTSGMLYKNMGLKDKLPGMTEEEQYALLATDGMLVKRPILVGEDFVLTGFKEKEWEEKLLG